MQGYLRVEYGNSERKPGLSAVGIGGNPQKIILAMPKTMVGRIVIINPFHFPFFHSLTRNYDDET